MKRNTLLRGPFEPEEIHGCTFYHGDCREVLGVLSDASVDSVLTDPPYGLKFMGKDWDRDIAFQVGVWREVFRVLKPGGHMLAFGGTRTFHRLTCAIEDAGFEIRDCLMWLYGSGFPKSHNVAVAVDKMNGIGPRSKAFNMKGRGDRAEEMDENGREFLPPYEAATDAACQWQGWGTALKPAWEPIILARKPLIGTVAQNVLHHGTGAINIDGCKIGTSLIATHAKKGMYGMGSAEKAREQGFRPYHVDNRDLPFSQHTGRWPANVIHDGSDEVVDAFPDDMRARGNITPTKRTVLPFRGGFGESVSATFSGDSGSAARFFYCVKASAADRCGSKHPTIKPIKLKRYLARLITPVEGLVLDLFAGSGTTGAACAREGFRSILIEQEAEYINDIRRRMQKTRPNVLRSV